MDLPCVSKVINKTGTKKTKEGLPRGCACRPSYREHKDKLPGKTNFKKLD